MIRAGIHLTRNPKGETIIGLLISTILMTVAATVVLALMVVNTKQNNLLYNKADVSTSSREAYDRIGRLVRTARNLGDVYGVVQAGYVPNINVQNMHGSTSQIDQTNNAQNLTAIQSGASFLISNYFPSAGDPYYSNGAAPPGPGWPNWPAQMVPANVQQLQSNNMGTITVGPLQQPVLPERYFLGPDCLIIQVPVFVANPNNPLHPNDAVWPATYNGQVGGGANGSLQAMDTYVFRVFPDSTNPGTYVMQECCFQANPGGNGPTNANQVLLSAPATIVRGIVGPVDPTLPVDPTTGKSIPAVFQYINRVDDSSTYYPPDTTHNLTDYVGVTVQLEILKKAEGNKSSVADFTSEFYFRNNTQTELMGQAGT